jgi:hypothetical protein
MVTVATHDTVHVGCNDLPRVETIHFRAQAWLFA